MIKNAIEFIDISKYFGEIKANRDISFEVEKGKIHALIGENGAGKSTLMSILFGLYQPDKGIIKINNKEVLIKGPNDANALGIGMVHQHFKLVDVYTNLENIVLGEENYNKATRMIDYSHAIQKIQTIQNAFNLHFDLNQITGKETVGVQQKVEIMKMLYRDSEILIFDEPTAVLTDEEIQGLLHTFKLFREQGKTIVFISHKLGEIKEVADNATILRHGKVVGNFKVSEVSIEEMASRMVGGEVENIRNKYTDTSQNKVILKLSNVSTKGEKSIKNISLEIKSGEIMAIAGIEGNGQRDLEYAISGMKPIVSGSIEYKKTTLIDERYKKLSKEKQNKIILFFGLFALLLVLTIIFFAIPSERSDTGAILKIYGGISCFLALLFLFLGLDGKFHLIRKIKQKINAKKAKEGNKNQEETDSSFIRLSDYGVYDVSKLGFSFIPSDRHKHGLVLDYNIKLNSILRRLWDKKYQKFTFLKNNNIQQETNEIIEKYDVRGARRGLSISRSLSGGNQQKFIVGREMNSPHDFILIVQPTRGLDVGAINNIHQRILAEKEAGKAILLISYELDEVLALADKIAVINSGEILMVKEAKNLTRTEIGVYMARDKTNSESVQITKEEGNND
ncbi:ABC transporter ATP-binding protein [Mycoplasmopsis glycophila]|uniref:Simple sugar ABC transporter ATP-binding protein,P59-like protein n=1 Tax=Mycoplasmopsis glycophila TaxID=171285 RepID=A0A449AUI5_9BACT|nr:ABC transporter ATP-binding protein [Mycoplasmopsis glycophila]VEU70148.1 simple sugar ABC transporter ATP-binding protein,P59-like protein [Mycoplasmopsis glycophila]